MVISNKELEKRLKNALTDSKILKYSLVDIDRRSFTKEEVMKASSTLGIIRFEDNSITVLDENDEVYATCPDFGVSTQTNAEWVSSFIDEIDFDVDFNGEVEKANESSAAYILRVVRDVLNERSFSDEYDNLCEHYSFESLCVPEDDLNYSGERTFQSLLKSWQDIQSFTVDVLISAAKFKISSFKKDSSLYLRTGMPTDAVTELRKLAIEVNRINSNYANGPLSSEAVKRLTKLEILSLLDAQRREVSSVVAISKFKDLYAVLNLTTEYVDPVTKKELLRIATIELGKLFNSSDYSPEFHGDKKKLLSQWKKRYLKTAKLSLQKELCIKYFEDFENFRLPTKL